MYISRSTFAATVLLTVAQAQGVNCALLGTFNNHGLFNDVWGYVAPNGDEYALLGARTGTVVVDITNPANPIERGWFPWGDSIWRDIRTFDNYAYVVTEDTAGCQVIDLSNPNNPTLVGVFGANITSNIHNVCIDLGTGKLYFVDTSFGTPAFDLLQNPTNPPYIGMASNTGFHDLCVQNGIAYASHINGGVLRLMNANTSLPYNVFSNTSTPSNFTHNCWPNDAGTICVTTDERPGGVIQFYDITNKSNPIALDQYTPNPGSIPHNAFIVGNKCHVSWYTEGYRCIDFSDPNNVVEVASYDTYQGSGSGTSGAWGCYPFLPSGNILVSDIQTGLYIVRPGNASFTKYGAGCDGSATEPCPELNANGGTLSGNTNQYEYTFRVPISGSMQVSSFDIYTQSEAGTLVRPAHIYVDAGSEPAFSPLATTTITVGTSPGFYTATFNPPVTVNGTFYIGYENSPDGVICNLDSGDNGVGFYRNAGSGNWNQSNLVQQPSWRVNCSGTGTIPPAIGNNGLPIPGTTYDVTLADAAPVTFAVMISGISDTQSGGAPLPLPLPGAPGCSLYASTEVLTLAITSAAGTTSSPIAVPTSPASIGASLFHQWAVIDNVNPLGIVVSDAARATIDN